MVGMFKILKELKKLRKEGGMALCKPCLERKVASRTADKEGFQKSLDSGIYKEAPKDKKCFLCESDAEYMVSLTDAMSAIKQVSKMKKG